MTVPVARKPNIEPGLQDQTNIALNLFNTEILVLKNNWKLDSLEISSNPFFLQFLAFLSCP
jgi:hypothetical protein